jgi:acyl carrier protein
MLRQVIDDFLLAQGAVSPEKLADPHLKMSELGLDSLGVVEVLFEVEDRYGIHVDDVAQFQNMTLNEVTAHMEKIVMSKNGGEWPTETLMDKQFADPGASIA